MIKMRETAAGSQQAPSPNISVTRSFSLMVFGALVGLVIAGYALFTAKGTTTLFVPADDVALVNQQPIVRTDYFALLQASYQVDFQHASVEQRHAVLEDMIREELFVQRGKELDVAETDPDVRTAMVNAVEQMAAADVVTRQPEEAVLRTFYREHQDRYSEEGVIALHDLIFPAADIAAQAAAALSSGGPVAAVLARFHGRESGKVDGEEFYFAAKLHLGDALFDVAKILPNSGVSIPTQQPDGIHVLYVVKNTPPRARDFNAVEAAVLNDYRNEQIKRTIAQYRTFLAKRAAVQIAEDVR
jgi:parvulin-like peptidyl-prolyl isomerase